jgi:hypothetical protein
MLNGARTRPPARGASIRARSNSSFLCTKAKEHVPLLRMAGRVGLFLKTASDSGRVPCQTNAQSVPALAGTPEGRTGSARRVMAAARDRLGAPVGAHDDLLVASVPERLVACVVPANHHAPTRLSRRVASPVGRTGATLRGAGRFLRLLQSFPTPHSSVGQY